MVTSDTLCSNAFHKFYNSSRRWAFVYEISNENQFVVFFRVTAQVKKALKFVQASMYITNDYQSGLTAESADKLRVHNGRSWIAMETRDKRSRHRQHLLILICFVFRVV
jgi:hypothetical protein